MTTFSVATTSSATVDSDRQRVWDALTDPDLVSRLTPYLRRIDARVDSRGDRWTWHLVRIPVLGSMVSPSFTEVMTFDEPSRHRLRARPRATGGEGRGRGPLHAQGDPARGTDVSIELTITVDLPFPALARPAVHAAMRAVVATMGARFSHNLVRHLDRHDQRPV